MDSNLNSSIKDSRNETNTLSHSKSKMAQDGQK